MLDITQDNQLIPEAGDPGVRSSRFRIALLPIDYAFLTIASLLLIPAFSQARLPLRIDFSGFADTYWIGTASHGAFVAILLAILGLPLGQTLIPFLKRYRRQKTRIVIASATAVWLSALLGLELGLMTTIVALACAELMERKADKFEAVLLDVFWPGLYFFWGIILVFAFNHAIAGIRYAGTCDEAFKHLDCLLFHADVSRISQWGMSHLPYWLSYILQYSYFSLYSQICAVLFLTCLLGGQPLAMRYVRAMLIGYSIALFLFFFWPASGPYLISPAHLSGSSPSLRAFEIQDGLVKRAQLIWAHKLVSDAGMVDLTDYYIAFPCMHIGLVTIAIWFVYPWKRMAWLIIVFDTILLVPSIILLQWHYITDLFAGVAVAFLSIWLSGLISRKAA